MRPRKIEDEELYGALLATFRLKGYDGTSMHNLEIASGLKKASLYHRYPNGTKEMAHNTM